MLVLRPTWAVAATYRSHRESRTRMGKKSVITFGQVVALITTLSLALPSASQGGIYWADDFENHLTPNWDTTACGIPARKTAAMRRSPPTSPIVRAMHSNRFLPPLVGMDQLASLDAGRTMIDPTRTQGKSGCDFTILRAISRMTVMVLSIFITYPIMTGTPWFSGSISFPVGI